ncbi:hypothetical protein ACKF11_12360 [Methylobacillus sp. Pita2]|uniref:hypothetical protein n=1 Tax=Methylobacillus sp. Pita2 TaxID=3383245 RepID=UPI0038B6619D
MMLFAAWMASCADTHGGHCFSMPGNESGINWKFYYSLFIEAVNDLVKAML